MPAQAPSGRIGLADEQGQSQAGNFEGQARVTFRAIDLFSEEAVGSAQSSLCVNDARGLCCREYRNQVGQGRANICGMARPL